MDASNAAMRAGNFFPDALLVIRLVIEKERKHSMSLCHSVPKSAYPIAKYFYEYGELWNKHFENCFRRSHWHIINMLRFDDDGILFSVIRGRMNDIYGMDESTCALRLQELLLAGFAAVDDTDIRASTIVVGTPKLQEAFDAHMIDVANALFDTAIALGHPIAGKLANGGMTINRIVKNFSTGYGSFWADRMENFLKEIIPATPSLRLKIQRQLMTYAYWLIFIKSWMHSSSSATCYLLVDDFHIELYPRLGVSWKTTAGYVQNLITWGFLVRLDRNAGVPKGKFATRMADPAFRYFADVIAGAEPFVVKVSQELEALCPGSNAPAKDVGDPSVVAFPTPSKRVNA